MRLSVYVSLLLAAASAASAASTRVTSISALQTAINQANPGDTITLANGSYSAGSTITVSRAGTSSAPITITPDTVGGATISGAGQFSFSGTASYVTVRGFRFTGTGTLRAALGSDHCRISRNLFQNGSIGGRYVWLYGVDHEIDYNTFRDKATGGPPITLDTNLTSSHTTHSGTQRIYIHHNYFLNITDADNSGAEAIQTWGGHTRAEYNLFDHADGDPEAISSKASDCIYRYNTFRNQVRGRLTLRYARRCTVEGNFFLGSVGLRVYGDGHKIRNNYFENADMPVGDAKSGYLRVVNTEIAFNTFVNSPVTPISGDAGGEPDGTLRIANNIFQGDSGTLVSVHGSPTYEGNIVWGAAATGTVGGAWRVDPQLARNGNGILHIGSSSPAVDASDGSYSLGDDLDGQPRVDTKDIGADEVSSATVTRHALSSADVGPSAGSGTSPTPTPTPTPTPVAGATATPTPTPTPTPASGGFSGYYRVMARHSGKAMVVQSASTANAANVFQWSYGGATANDEWEIRAIDSGYYRLINRHSGKDLNVSGVSTANGGDIIQYTYGGTSANDEWAVVDVGGGYFRITNRHSGKSADVQGASTADGANIHQWSYSGGTNQQWQLISVP